MWSTFQIIIINPGWSWQVMFLHIKLRIIISLINHKPGFDRRDVMSRWDRKQKDFHYRLLWISFLLRVIIVLNEHEIIFQSQNSFGNIWIRNWWWLCGCLLVLPALSIKSHQTKPTQFQGYENIQRETWPKTKFQMALTGTKGPRPNHKDQP